MSNKHPQKGLKISRGTNPGWLCSDGETVLLIIALKLINFVTVQYIIRNIWDQ